DGHCQVVDETGGTDAGGDQQPHLAGEVEGFGVVEGGERLGRHHVGHAAAGGVEIGDETGGVLQGAVQDRGRTAGAGVEVDVAAGERGAGGPAHRGAADDLRGQG